jgi:hypothetical protein
MTRAAMSAAVGARRINDTLTGLTPELPPSDPLSSARLRLVSIAMFGQQFDVLFESGEMPDHRTLATVDAGLRIVAEQQQGLIDALTASNVEPC